MKLIHIIAISVVLFIPGLAAAKLEKAPEAHEKTARIYFKKSGMFYIADPSTQLCFASPAADAYVLIPCVNLKKKAEFKDVITWEN